ncbi:MAG: flagellin lysine-N-methylase [Lachnospiraceae bacterium]|nr:flagellin lysine-N-methylase [Lachnospiraceae bacterium]
MKIELKPDFHEEFNCIADRCSFTCCQEWKIAVDKDTFRSWKETDYEGRKLNTYTVSQSGARVISLNEGHQCPFLSANQLCELVTRHGDSILSHTCATFPRQIHRYRERTEYALVSCCPEVVDLLNRQESFRLEGDCGEPAGEENIAGMKEIRQTLMKIIQEPSFDINTELMCMFEIMLGILKNGRVTRKELGMCEGRAYLQKLTDDISAMEFDENETFQEDNELFLDLVENYRKEELYTRHLSDMVSLAEKLEEEYEKYKIPEQLKKFRTEFAQYERLFRNYLAAELFTNGLLPNSPLDSLAVMLQWISLQYVTIRHSIFLKWLRKGSGKLEYSDVRDSIVLISRITGYSQSDIYEYLDNSFQSRIWEWGYEALIVGR